MLYSEEQINEMFGIMQQGTQNILYPPPNTLDF